MSTTPEERRPCYDAIEAYLNRQQLDYELHFQPGDVGGFEEYRLTNLEPFTILFPAILPPAPESEERIRGGALAAARAHADNYAQLRYDVVLCGEGWTDERARALQESLAPAAPANAMLTVRTLDALVSGAL